MLNTAIVAIGFNRPDSLGRLLSALNKASYPIAIEIPLVVALDYQDSESHLDTLEAAEEFVWLHGPKKIIAQKKNLGLKKHVLTCGDLVEEYDALIMFEDDIYPSMHFYEYAIHALVSSLEDEKIAGISLYNHRFNVIANLPFEPIYDGFDNYFLQFASSWGQAWTKKQWKKFREWNDINPTIERSFELPQKVIDWPDTSWLKHFNHYLIRTNTTFSYPRVSYSTNFSDTGTHAKSNSTEFQVPLSLNDNLPKLAKYKDTIATYDCFFELISTSLTSISKIELPIDVVVDLYGKKDFSYLKESRPVITSKKPINENVPSYGMLLKPMENNLIYGVDGNTFFLDVAGNFHHASLFTSNKFSRDLLSYFYGRISIRILVSNIFLWLRERFKI